MGGPNLEVFKFGMYIFFPIGWMYYFGTNLDQRFSVPDFWPKKDETNQIPFEREDIADELERLKARRLEARARRLQRAAMENGEQGVRAMEEEEEQERRKGPSAYMKSLGNERGGSAWRVAGQDKPAEKESSGKGWFGLW